jgi:hypothetical protein
MITDKDRMLMAWHAGWKSGESPVPVDNPYDYDTEFPLWIAFKQGEESYLTWFDYGLDNG